MQTQIPRRDRRRWTHRRIRKKVQGTAERPRLSVCKTLKHIYAQVIDDGAGRTLAAASTCGKKSGIGYGGNVAAAREVGKLLADKAKAAGIEAVVFDRGGHKYHGRVKALADSAREAGLKF